MLDLQDLLCVYVLLGNPCKPKLLVIPVECDRSFSTLRCLKTCLRTSMGQERLTSLALICMTVERVAKLEAGVKDLVN